MRHFAWILLGIICSSFSAYAQATLSGQVMDASSGEPLTGASISIPDLARQTTADETGHFSLEGLPYGNFTVQISFLGYKTLAERIPLRGPVEKTFQLTTSLLEIREVVVTATASASSNHTNSVSVESVSAGELRSHAVSNLVDAIAFLPGVAQITSGPAISKPVIRGLSYNRVLTVHDGVRQEGQQWGDEHGLEFDLFAADRVEVLRGPASLLYGSDAMGGVINILDPLPLPEGEIKGTLTSRYASNNGLTGSSLMLEGNQGGFVWRGRGSYRNASSYDTPAGYAPNTAFNETNFSGMLGLNKRWGYTHFNISSYSGNLGFPEHEHGEDHDHEAGENPAEDDQAAEANAWEAGRSRQVALPMQEVRHVKASVNNNFIFGEQQLRVVLGYQKNKRREFEHSTSEPGMSMDLETWSADLKFFMADLQGFEPIVGLSGSRQQNRSGGEELLIPAYVSSEGGAFVYLRKAFGTLHVNAGARFDYRDLQADAGRNTEGELQFGEFDRSFSNFSGSVGLAWDLGSGFLVKANAGSAFRAPNISELASNGEHHGVERFEIGNQELRSEQSFQLDASVGYASQMFGFELNGYTNTIYHFIYLRGQTGDSLEHEGEVLPVYRYTQADARLSGLEAVVDLHPLPWLHIGSSFSLVRGTNRETDGALPFIPAASWNNELKIEPELKSGLLRNTYFSVGLSSTFEQRHVDKAFEHPAEAYHLVTAGLGTTLALGRFPVTLYVSGENLFDISYISHLSRYRDLGLLNAGRNLQFGLHVPFELN